MRFRILDHTGGYMAYQPEKIAKISISCCMLHNICRRRRIPIDVDGITESDNVDEAVNHGETPQNEAGGVEKRRMIIQAFS